MSDYTFTPHDYEIVNHEVIYKGFMNFVRYDLRFRLFNSEMSDILNREVLERRPAAALLPYDPVTDQVVLTEQFRPGALTDKHSPWILEMVAGTFEQGEKAEEVAIREAKEEANLDVTHIHFIGDYYSSPGGSNEKIFLFCGCIDASNKEGVYGLSEESENIRTHVFSAEEAFSFVTQGKICSAMPTIALQWLQLNRDWLKLHWLTLAKEKKK